MCNAPPLANVKHADDYTIEDLNADVEAFRLAFVRYMRARRRQKAEPRRQLRRAESGDQKCS
jgi:hypothetical protein